MFAREGYAIIAVAFALGLFLIGIGFWLGGWLGVPFFLLGVAAAGFTLYFFRDPERTPPPGADELLLSPADGTVVEIVEDEMEPLYLEEKATRISIFLSPLNVHVNRVPARGQVEYVNYEPGEYLVAWHPKASDKNERSELGVRHDPSGTKVLFKQIAGAVARRIVYHLREGDRVEAGQRFGLVKFGSRMDVLVPPHVALQVEKGQRVYGGESVLGELAPERPGDAASPEGATDASETSTPEEAVPPTGAAMERGADKLTPTDDSRAGAADDARS